MTNIFNSGVDWITLTNKRGYAPEAGLDLVFSEHSLNPEAWAVGGYSGLRCTETGLRYGERKGRDGKVEEILIASGKFSSEIAGSNWDLYANCTRIDFQVTVYLDSPEPHLAKAWYEEFEAAFEAGETMTGRRKRALILSDTGETLYVGSRKSGRKFFRFYDKSHDYGADRGTVWRQEVQYGRRFADKALWFFRTASEEDRVEAMAEMVFAEFMGAMSKSLIWTPGDAVDIIVEPAAEESGIQKRLEWLRACVRPVVERLDNAGYAHDALAALFGDAGSWVAWPRED